MSDGLFTMVGLVGAVLQGPSNAGSRKDDKVCTAQGGECRRNSKYYTPGMGDVKSWTQPYADESCTEACPYLKEQPRQIPQEQQEGIVALLLGREESND